MSKRNPRTSLFWVGLTFESDVDFAWCKCNGIIVVPNSILPQNLISKIAANTFLQSLTILVQNSNQMGRCRSDKFCIFADERKGL